MIQTIIVIVAISGAAAYLGWQFYKRFYSKSSECESCAVGKLAQD